MSEQLKVALIRAVIGAVIAAGATFFTTAASGQPLKVAGIGAGAAFFSYLVLRGGIEGTIDAQAAKSPTPVQPAP